MITITYSQKFGREVTALQDIKRGDVVELSELLVFNKQDTAIVNTTDLQWYTFKYNKTQDCLCLGVGEIFNHDDNANVSFKLVAHDGRKKMQFKALRAIGEGEQLFINYNADVTVQATHYVDKNMI